MTQPRSFHTGRPPGRAETSAVAGAPVDDGLEFTAIPGPRALGRLVQVIGTREPQSLGRLARAAQERRPGQRFVLQRTTRHQWVQVSPAARMMHTAIVRLASLPRQSLAATLFAHHWVLSDQPEGQSLALALHGHEATLGHAEAAQLVQQPFRLHAAVDAQCCKRRFAILFFTRGE